jgi:hypothetical protein
LQSPDATASTFVRLGHTGQPTGASGMNPDFPFDLDRSLHPVAILLEESAT